MKALMVGPGILAVAAVEAAVSTPTAEGWSVAEVLLVIGAVTTAITTIITAWRSGQAAKAVEAVAAIPPRLDALSALVDPPTARLLQEMADVKLVVADLTGLWRDRAAAEKAQVKADDQQAKVSETKQAVADATVEKPNE